MKKFSIFAISALLLVAFSVPAMAKVNLSGALWVTYWAQQEATMRIQTNTGGAWNELTGMTSIGPGQAVTYGAPPQASKKTFIVGQNLNGDGLALPPGGAHAVSVAQNGLLIVADCPVTDWVKAYAELNAGDAARALTLREGYADLAFMKELSVAIGLQEVPFGNEHLVRPDAGVEEVFISEYSQDARGALQTQSDVALKVYGTVGSGLIGGGVGMIDYSLFVGNGVLNTAADSVALIGASQASPDIDDGKQVGLNVRIKPITGLYVGGAYFAGDYTTPWGQGGRSRSSSYDFNAGYDIANVLLISGEYATTRHNDKVWNFQNGTAGAVPVALQSVRVNEYVLKAIYDGIQDFELGVRYGVVDPKGLEAEIETMYSRESKLTFAGEYKFARAAVLKAEYSLIDTNLEYLDKYDAANVAAGSTRLTPSDDPDDSIFAVQVGLQF